MSSVILSAPSFTSSNSFSKMARYHAFFLEDQGVDVFLHERGEPRPAEIIPVEHRIRINSLISKGPGTGATWLFYDIPDGMAQRQDSINLTTYESANLRPRWVEYSQKCLHTCVISRHNRYMLVGEGVSADHVSVVNLGYDPNLYYPGADPLWPKDDKVCFLYVNHFNPRKGIETLLHAFCDEFGPEDPVKLLLVTQSMYDRVDVRRTIDDVVSRHPNPPEIQLHLSPFNGGFPEHNMARVYASGDCLVNPTKGEAFGLPNLEALACGLEVIATKCGGQLDYLSEENCHFIEVDNITEDPACIAVNESYSGLQFWIPSHESLRQQMRNVFEGSKKGGVPENWTWEDKTPALLGVLERLGL